MPQCTPTLLNKQHTDYSTLILGVFPLDQIAHVGVSSSINLKLISRKIIFEVFQPMWSRFLNVTDGRQTTYCGTTALCVASRGKNRQQTQRIVRRGISCETDIQASQWGHDKSSCVFSSQKTEHKLIGGQSECCTGNGFNRLQRLRELSKRCRVHSADVMSCHSLLMRSCSQFLHHAIHCVYVQSLMKNRGASAAWQWCSVHRTHIQQISVRAMPDISCTRLVSATLSGTETNITEVTNWKKH